MKMTTRFLMLLLLAGCDSIPIGGALDGPAPIDMIIDATGPGDEAVLRDFAVAGVDLYSACGADLLNDPHNCGACGHDCLGGACVGAACQPVVLSSSYTTTTHRLAIDQTNVYFTWSSGGSGAVMSCAKGGCSDLPQQLATGLDPQAVATDGKNVYWIDVSQASTGALFQCAVSGCNNNPIALVGRANSPYVLTAGPDAVYFGSYANSATTGVMYKCAIGGCNSTPTALVSGQAPSSIAHDGSFFYWTNASVQKLPAVERCAFGGCNNQPTTIAGAPAGGSAGALSIDATNVYWAADNAVLECPVGGCGQSPTVVYNAGVNQTAVDATNIYFVYGRSGEYSLMRCAIDQCKGGPVTLMRGLPYVGDIAVDDTSIYYIADNVFRLAK